MREAIAASINRALDYLEKSQLPSGQFPMEFTVRANTGANVGPAGTHPELSPFCTSYAVPILLLLNDDRAKRMAHRALDFLEKESVRGGLWRYWCKSAPLHSQIPPDVDDTSCISDALRSAGRKFPQNTEVILANRRSDGLFYTWIALRPALNRSRRWITTVLTDVTFGRLIGFWRAGARRDDVDAVVNANVVMYLGKRDETAAAIRWLRKVAQAGREIESDKWYRSSAAFYYAVSRCIETEPGQPLDLREQMSKSFGLSAGPNVILGMNELQRSMAVSAALNFRVPLPDHDQIIDSIVRAQQEDGSWPSYPIYYDGRDEPMISWGSSAVTTAMCIEALHKSLS